MNNNKLLFLFLLVSLAGRHDAGAQDLAKKDQSFTGTYQSGREILYIQPKNIFWMKRAPQKNDVVVPECNDTIARGTWKITRTGVLELANSKDFEAIAFNIRQEKKISEDSVYIEILMPKDDAFFEGRFTYNLFLWNGIGDFQSTKNLIVLPKEKASRNGKYNFSLIIKDGSPRCNPGQKCYQRIFFRVFDDLDYKDGNNYFSIKLTNFNECFVERMDIDHELLLASRDQIYWRGKVYAKLK